MTAFFRGGVDAVGIVTRVIVTRGMMGSKKTAQGIPIPALHRFRCELLIEEKFYEIDFHIWFDTTTAGAALSLTYTRVDSWTRIRQPCWILDSGIS